MCDFCADDLTMSCECGAVTWIPFFTNEQSPDGHSVSAVKCAECGAVMLLIEGTSNIPC